MFDSEFTLLAAIPEWIRFLVSMALTMVAVSVTWAMALVLTYHAFARVNWRRIGRVLIVALGGFSASISVVTMMVFFWSLPQLSSDRFIGPIPMSFAVRVVVPAVFTFVVMVTCLAAEIYGLAMRKSVIRA